MLAGAVVGLCEALWVLTGAGAGEYWALFAGVLVYGLAGSAAGLLVGTALGLHRAIGGIMDPSRGLSLSAVAVGCTGGGLLLFDGLTSGVYRGRGLPSGVVVLMVGALVMVGVVGAWMGPIFLTRTPLKALLRPKGGISAWAGLLLLSALFSLAPAPGGGEVVAPMRDADAVHGAAPDMLLVVVEGLRPSDLDRPGLVEVSRSGIRFDAAYAQAGWGGGALASLLTGAPPPLHRVLGPADRRTRALPTVLEVLQGEGYATAWVEGGPDGPRAADLVAGVDWSTRPGRDGAIPESSRRLRLVQLMQAGARGAADLDAVFGAVEGAVSANRERGNRWAVVVRLFVEDVADVDALGMAMTSALERMDARGDLARALIAVVGVAARGEGSVDLADARLHVPMVLVLPEGQLEGQVASWAVRTMDLAPTLVVQGRAPLPSSWWAQDLLEQDAVDLLTGRVAPPPDRDWEALPDERVISPETLARPVVAAQDLDGVSRVAFRSGEWKYVRRRGPDGRLVEELYNIEQDPHETDNMAARAARQRVRMGRSLGGLLAEWSGSEGPCAACIAGMADPAACATACGAMP
ncbi:MAG: hypothetical protein VX265_14640 [Myxococcota bacterium]|nr:hypothetical protein [Myxococcota bacterium]